MNRRSSDSRQPAVNVARARSTTALRTVADSGGGSGLPGPGLLLHGAHGDPAERHGVRIEAVGVPVLEERAAAAVVLGDHETPPLDHLGVGGRELLRRVVALAQHDALVLAREVVLD